MLTTNGFKRPVEAANECNSKQLLVSDYNILNIRKITFRQNIPLKLQNKSKLGKGKVEQS